MVANAGATALAAPGPYICAGGVISAGTYDAVTVTGFCTLPDSGTIRVQGNLTLTSGAALNAVTPATLLVDGNVRVGSGALLGLGCSPAIGCNVTTADRVGGNLTAEGAALVIVHSATIGGNVSLMGGGGNEDCTVSSPIGPPFYSDFEDNHIGGNTTVSGLVTCWFGYLRNWSGGNVTLTNNTYGDPDADEIVTNHILGNLSCWGNSPPPQVGDSGGFPNVVVGHKLGQCANIQ
jgi:hypothetical protein